MFPVLFLQALVLTVGGILEKIALEDKQCGLDSVSVNFVYSAGVALVMLMLMLGRNGTKMRDLQEPRNKRALKYILGSALVCSFGMVLYFYTLKHMQVGERLLFLAPMGMVLTLLLSYFFLHEPLFNGKQYALVLYLAAGYAMYRVSTGRVSDQR